MAVTDCRASKHETVKVLPSHRSLSSPGGPTRPTVGPTGDRRDPQMAVHSPIAEPGPYRGCMASQSAAIDISHPPEALLRAINPVLRRLLRTPLGGRMSEFMLISFTGRKTGRRFTVPVSAHPLDGDLYVVLEASWKYNFRDGADADVHHRGSRTLMRGQLITDRSTVAEITHRLAQSYGPRRAQRTMGLKFRDGQVPTVAQWEAAVDRLGISAIKLTPKS